MEWTKTGEAWFASLSTHENQTVNYVIYPNPARESFTVSGINNDAVIELYNSLGMKVFEQKFIGETSFVPNVTPGIYLAKITNDGRTAVKKVVIR